MIFLMSSGKHVSIAGYQVLRVLTSSMEPAISENTCIIIKKYPVDQLKVGDIITFTSDDPQIQGMYNTHRIHDIVEENGETLYVTKGDAIDAVDAYPVHKDQVAGILVRELPGGQLLGKCFVALSDNRIYFLVIILPLMICLMSYFWQIVGIFRKPEEDEEEDEEVPVEETWEKPNPKAETWENTSTQDLEYMSEKGFGMTPDDDWDVSEPEKELSEPYIEEFTSDYGTSEEELHEMDAVKDTVVDTAKETLDSWMEENYRYTEEDFKDMDYKY